MKILITCDPEIPVPPSNYGGIERMVEVIIIGLLKQGHDVILCANPHSKVQCKLVGWKGLKSRNILDTIKNTLMLTQLVYKEKFDVVHSFSRLAYMTFIMPIKVKKIMSYQREPSLNQIAKAIKLSKKKSIIFTGCSDYISNQIAKIASVYTIYNCAPIEKYIFQEIVLKNAPLVFLGRIEPIKGTHNAIAIAKKSNQKLIIAGNIPLEYQNYFDTEVLPLLNDDIKYIGVVNDEQKNVLLRNAIALLMPIEWNEPFGIVMAEAMACGTPIIGFPKGAVKEIVQHGINGYLCNSIDDAVEKVLMLDKIDREVVRKIAEDKFSNTKIINDYIDLYNKHFHSHII